MERPFDPLHPRGFVTTRIPFCFPSPHRTRKLVFRSRNGNDEVSTTRVSSFEFRISSTRFFHFSIFLSLSIINFSPQLLHLSFLFPSVTDPLLLSSIHSFLSLRATLHLFFLLLSWVHLDAFPLSLSLCRSSLSPALDTGNAVPLSRAERCGNVARAGVRRARGGDCGKILMPATVCPPPVVLTTTVATGNPARLPAFTLQERFTAHAKKEGRSRERGKKVYH